MIKSISKYLLMGGIALIHTGCLFEQQDIFEQSPAERLENAKKETKEILVSAPNGWVMQYFPTPTKQGYTMLMKFQNSGATTIAGKSSLTGNKYQTDDSSFEMIADHGPVLTFNTYNDILHAFSNPQNPTGLGQEGDYEFVIMEKDPSEVKLQGKKRETDIRMYPLGEGVNWENYFTQIDDINTIIFGGLNNTLQYIAGDQIAGASGGLNGIFTIMEEGQPASEYTNMPLLITPTGLKLYEPFTMNGKTAQNFILSEDKSKLISAEDESVYILGPKVSDYIVNSQVLWKISGMSESVEALYTAMSENFTQQYGGKRDLEYCGFSYSTTLGQTFAIKVLSTALSNIALTITSTGSDEVTISLSDPINGDNNGKRFYNEVGKLKEFLDNIQGSYKVTTEQSFLLSQIKYVKTSDSNFYFTVNQ